MLPSSQRPYGSPTVLEKILSLHLWPCDEPPPLVGSGNVHTHEVLQQLGTLHSPEEAKFRPTTHPMGQPNGLPIRVPRHVIILGSALSVRAQPAQLLTGGDGTGAKCGNRVDSPVRPAAPDRGRGRDALA